MKLGVLASLLGKDEAELRGSLNLESDSSEVDDQIAGNKIKDHISIEKINAKQAGLSEGKKQSDGRQTRETMESVEKKLKDMGIEGSNFDEQLEFISKNKGTGNKDVNKELEKKFSVLQAKYNDLELKNNDLIGKIEKIGLEKGLNTKLNPIIEKFKFATDLVKSRAIKDFVDSNKFLENDGEVFLLDADGKPTTKFEESAKVHFLQWGIESEQKPNVPPGRETKPPGNYGTTLDELFIALDKASTPEEMAAIQEKINKIDKSQ